VFAKILVPLDASAMAEQALPVAAGIANRTGAELRLVLVHEPIPFDGYPDAPWNAVALGTETAYLDGKARELEARQGIRAVTDHRTGSAIETIVSVAHAQGVELVVMTTHGRTGLSRVWLGSVADSVMRSLDVPVLMLRPVEHGAAQPTDGTFHRIMIPLDGSARAESIIDVALVLGGPSATYLLAQVTGPVPIVLSSSEPYALLPVVVDVDATALAVESATRYLQGVAEKLRAKGMTSIEQTVITSELTAPTLLELATAKHVDLVAIATHGRGASRLVFGSVADKLLRGGTTPLLLGRDRHR
jgi:nucleotide-binding universal stress UspA family protein